jgi:polyhydroxyalkanoate synthesis regulator protein
LGGVGGVGGMFPFSSLEEMGKQNMAIFEQAMKMFSPMGNAPGSTSEGEQPDAAPSEDDDTVADLQEKLNALQQQLNSMAKKSGQ